MLRRSIRWAGRWLVRTGNELLTQNGSRTVWIDVGAHLGESTFSCARMDPAITVFAFEPNWALAKQLMGRLANFVVLPMAVSEKDGQQDFFVNADDHTSSLLPFTENGPKNWKGGESLRVEKKAVVPTIRLDTFIKDMGIASVDYLKIDAQGGDFAVLRSAGDRLKDIRRITLEVDVAPVRLYHGSGSRDEIVRYMAERGFSLEAMNSQTFGQEENLTFGRKGRE